MHGRECVHVDAVRLRSLSPVRVSMPCCCGLVLGGDGQRRAPETAISRRPSCAIPWAIAVTSPQNLGATITEAGGASYLVERLRPRTQNMVRHGAAAGTGFRGTD